MTCDEPAAVAIEVYGGGPPGMHRIERAPVCSRHCGPTALALLILHSRKLVLDVAEDAERCGQPVPA